MNYLDLSIGVLLLWGFYKGFKNGFIMQIALLVALVLGIYGGAGLSVVVAGRLSDYLNWNHQYVLITSFAIVFVVVILIIYLLAKGIEKFINLASMGFVNKLAGAVFGFLKACLIAGVLLVFINYADKRLHFISGEQKESSLLFAPVTSIINAVFPVIENVFFTYSHPTLLSPLPPEALSLPYIPASPRRL